MFRLPTDVLWEIFLHCVAVDSESPYILQSSHQNNAFTLAWVCQRWRTLALASPTLWVTIAVDLRDPDPPEGHLSLLRMQLERSKPATLFMSLTDSQSAEPVVKDHPILPLILPRSSDWTHLHLSVKQSTLAVLEPLQNSVRSLVSLRIHIHPYNETSGVENFFGLTPSLKVLKTRNFDYQSAATSLTTFHFFHWCPPPAIFTASLALIKSNCETLTNLAFVVGTVPEFTASTERYCLPSLLDLVIACNQTPIGVLLQAIAFEAPGLLRLGTGSRKKTSAWDLHVLELLLNRCSCALDALRLGGNSPEGTGVETALPDLLPQIGFNTGAGNTAVFLPAGTTGAGAVSNFQTPAKPVPVFRTPRFSGRARPAARSPLLLPSQT